MKIKIGDVEIIYSENQKFMIDEINRIIKNNYELIISCLDESKTLDISGNESNFSDMFYNAVRGIYTSNVAKNNLGEENFLLSLHLAVLIRKKNTLGTTIIAEPIPEISDELLSTFIAYKYFETNGNFDDFVEYLKVRDREEEIFQWLNDISRWDTYNYLLDILYKFLITEDGETFKQLNSLMNVWLDEVIQKAVTSMYGDKKISEYQKISHEEFDKLFYDFLNYINAPNEWVATYNNLKKDNLISVNVDNDSSMVYEYKDGIFKIALLEDNSLRGFCDFVHEFIHYISMKNHLLLPKLSIREFTSIFFETICAEFLKEKGYAGEIVHQVVNSRAINNYSLYMSLRILFADLMQYINYGEVSRNFKVRLYQRQVDAINQNREKMLKFLIDAGEKIENLSEYEKLDFDIEKNVDGDCDSLIDAFIEDGFLVINGYQYLIDSYLVHQVLEKRKSDDTIILKMIEVTNNLCNMNIKDILKIFDIESVLQNELVKKLVKKPGGEF